MRFLDATPNGALAMDLLSTLPFMILRTHGFLHTVPFDTFAMDLLSTLPFMILLAFAC